VSGTAEAYRETVRQMVRTGTLLDAGMVYFDARLSEHYPTVEIRIADVCLHADDAVLVAALARALVDTAARCWRAGGPAGHQRTELLRLAAWRASRSGLADVLLNPVTGLPNLPQPSSVHCWHTSATHWPKPGTPASSPNCSLRSWPVATAPPSSATPTAMTTTWPR